MSRRGSVGIAVDLVLVDTPSCALAGRIDHDRDTAAHGCRGGSAAAGRATASPGEAHGADLVGPDGLLNQLTRNVLETALEAELSEHLA
jgi:hypothetical protein